MTMCTKVLQSALTTALRDKHTHSWHNHFGHNSAKDHLLMQAPPMQAEKCVLWEQLFTDSSQFDDLRHYNGQMGGTGPDFRHIESGQGLWWEEINMVLSSVWMFSVTENLLMCARQPCAWSGQYTLCATNSPRADLSNQVHQAESLFK